MASNITTTKLRDVFSSVFGATIAPFFSVLARVGKDGFATEVASKTEERKVNIQFIFLAEETETKTVHASLVLRGEGHWYRSRGEGGPYFSREPLRWFLRETEERPEEEPRFVEVPLPAEWHFPCFRFHVKEDGNASLVSVSEGTGTPARRWAWDRILEVIRESWSRDIVWLEPDGEECVEIGRDALEFLDAQRIEEQFSSL